MGTRALIHVQERGETLVTCYAQYDGYPDGVGAAIYRSLGRLKLVNGLRGEPDVMNGVKCAAAILIRDMKERPGGFYIYPPNASDVWEEFVYTIDGDTHEPGNGLHMKVVGYGDTLFDGPLSEFTPESCDEGGDA
ncbi:hypothetical protein ROJ8625_04120 [Roseivivax jejudonensis]|uniref:Uncharacterized protein n=1 Tax=Roseivivax jejudonensis TaxID=1529041 RepID=A0A1X7ABN7_9RHOB|nr:hypothetical protein [Roseivivax jejudonensis]SLN74885.1 hypothetical protein ROJ8625_04120 [Roseivivax jejudonensis]